MTTSLPHTQAAAVILVDGQGRVLIAERPAHKPIMPGYWEFPGGKLEEGETPDRSMRREAQEEIGVEPTHYDLMHIIEETRDEGTPHAYRVTVHVYLCRQWEGKVRAKEGQMVLWVKPDELEDHRLLPANVPLIPHLRRLLHQAARPD